MENPRPPHLYCLGCGCVHLGAARHSSCLRGAGARRTERRHRRAKRAGWRHRRRSGSACGLVRAVCGGDEGFAIDLALLRRPRQARVEQGDGVPFFHERFGCRDDGEWTSYRELVQYSRLRIFDQAEGPALARALAYSLARRTSNVTEILQCNVGVVAGYHLLARHCVAIADDWRAYNLLQLALIWVFTLRNANRVPRGPGIEWATRSDHLVSEIRTLRKRLVRERARWVARLPPVAPDFRSPSLRFAIVSICAYPADHPLDLKTLTPENRRLYAERHGYTLLLHTAHPMPDQGVHIQHAKLALMAKYLRSGEYDWLAWFDCDSIIMNFNKTLDSIVHRYARAAFRQAAFASGGGGREVSTVARKASGAASTSTSVAAAVARPTGAETGEAPSETETLVAYVSHAGSCNTHAGCRANVHLRVNSRVRYALDIATTLVDMEDPSERLASLSVGAVDFGECNPSPSSDYDCGLFDCVSGAALPMDAINDDGFVVLAAHSVRTNDDCMCSSDLGACYAAPLAPMYATLGENVTDISYGMFVKFTLTPQGLVAAPSDAHIEAPEDTTADKQFLDNSFSAEPLAHEVIEAYVGHVGSCNTDAGCIAETRVLVNRNARYAVTVSTALVDMVEASEKLVSISVGGHELGECNPSPEDDFDCSFLDCYDAVNLPVDIAINGSVELRVHAVRTSNDCHCNRIHGICYSAPMAAMEEHALEEPRTDPRYGMFVKFTLWPLRAPMEPAKPPPHQCCSKPAGGSGGVSLEGGEPDGVPTWAELFHRGAECAGADVLLGIEIPQRQCLELCHNITGCEHVAVGFGKKKGLCFWEVGSCEEFEDDSYDVYRVLADSDSDGLANDACENPCPPQGKDHGMQQDAQAPPGPARSIVNVERGDESVDLLITEEGWGLSSANWLIRRSEWSIDFLERAFRLCQEEMPLFGDQDAMIHLLLNSGALGGYFGGGMDPHAAVIPQHEINAYDALNAHYMEADAYTEGDLLVTFPGCKEARACNPLFNLAAATAVEAERGSPQEVPATTWARLRLFGPPELAAEFLEVSKG